MILLIAYIVLVAGFVAGVVVLVDYGGDVTMVWGAWEISTSVPVLVLGIALFTIVAILAVGLIGWLWRGPRRVKTAMGRRKREKGYEALTSGLVAVAAGDAGEARRHAKKADNLLGHPPLTLLLAAQAAQLDGDAETADQQFNAMLERPETEFLGLRGLMTAAFRRGDRQAAADYARRAHALRPDARWAAEAVFDLQALAGDWQGAQHTLESARDRRAIGASVSRRRRAILLVEEGRKALENLDRTEALKRAREAHDEAPDLVPATALLARLLIDQQKLRAAAKAIEKSWAATPHPELAQLYVETGRDRGVSHYKRINKLVTIAPQERESHLAATRAALYSELTGEARRHLGDLGDGSLTVRVARLWSELEEMEGHEELANRWRDRAVDADPEAAWQCDRCGHADAIWHAVCPGCEAFDAMLWQPPRGAVHPVSSEPKFLIPNFQDA
ncbi:MAG: heme biosynthesis protein HemY [Rhodospirillaceae bacterium]|jgi:HemY protein|nr:heme biosynthesis protein HemY [Rhodospirillaceae bacterium]MBT6513043.1 heme biosynthesis protein HemY [Rhodospirillaceae bacterium]MBT7613369.1 heme biosynthesis protein HemY [Rhodospirillaceae bacterium]MBT7646865.1 heme biosynthesis protein HemY [Rhodospirillaceae bacterium]